MSVHFENKQTTLDIIYVEDNPGDQQLLKEQLSMADDFQFTIRIAARVQDAHLLHQAQPTHLLLLDLNLEDTKDRDTIDLAVNNFSRVPILVLSQTRNLDISFYASSRGIVDFLIKDDSFKTEKLVRAILMAKMRWDLEQEKIELIENTLKDSLLSLNRSRQLLTQQVFIFSHKIRGPLCTIEGLMNLLDTKLDQETHHKLLKCLQVTYDKLKAEVDKNISAMENPIEQD